MYDRMPTFNPAPRESWKLLFQGAEAKVWKLEANDGSETWVCKERIAKAYRHPELDQRLTKARCRAETKALEKCLKKGTNLRVPLVIRSEPPLIYMECLDGKSLRSLIVSSSTGTLELGDEMIIARKMGEVVSKLHNIGLVHGDLTTSNMIVLDHKGGGHEWDSAELALIDFGLSKSTTSAEEQAVDLYVLERALLSTHPDFQGNFFQWFLESYSSTSNNDKICKQCLKRLDQVRMRGRKRECFG